MDPIGQAPLLQIMQHSTASLPDVGAGADQRHRAGRHHPPDGEFSRWVRLFRGDGQRLRPGCPQDHPQIGRHRTRLGEDHRIEVKLLDLLVVQQQTGGGHHQLSYLWVGRTQDLSRHLLCLTRGEGSQPGPGLPQYLRQSSPPPQEHDRSEDGVAPASQDQLPPRPKLLLEQE